MEPAPEASRERPPTGVLVWFIWVGLLLAVTGLLLPRIIAFVDISDKAPFSLLGLFMMAELAAVLFGLTLGLQRKRAGFSFALMISLLPAPILGGLVPLMLDFPPPAAAGWTTLTVPLGVAISVGLVLGLLRPASRAWFRED